MAEFTSEPALEQEGEDGDDQVDDLLRELYQDAEAIHDWTEFQMNQEADVKADSGMGSSPWQEGDAQQPDSDAMYADQMSDTSWASVLKKKDASNDRPSEELLTFLKVKEASGKKAVLSSSVHNRKGSSQWETATAIAEAAEPIVEVLTAGKTEDFSVLVSNTVEALGMQQFLGSASKNQNRILSIAFMMISLPGIMFMLAIATSDTSSSDAGMSDLQKFKSLNEAGKEPYPGKSELVLQEPLAPTAPVYAGPVGTALFAQQGVSQILDRAGPCYDKYPDCVSWADNGECTKNAVGMNDFCKQSCGVCQAPKVIAAEKSLETQNFQEKSKEEKEAEKQAKMKKELRDKENSIQHMLSEAVKDAKEGRVHDAAEDMLVKEMIEKEKEKELEALKKEQEAAAVEEAAPEEKLEGMLAAVKEKPSRTLDEQIMIEKAAYMSEENLQKALDIYRTRDENKKTKAENLAKWEQAKNQMKFLRNNKHECAKWAAEGECDANQNWMMANCARSCVGHFLNVKEKKKDASKNCPGWAAQGECLNNAAWMALNCMKSCAEAVGAPAPAPAPDTSSVVRGKNIKQKEEDLSPEMHQFSKMVSKPQQPFTVKKDQVGKGRFQTHDDVQTVHSASTEQHQKQKQKQSTKVKGIEEFFQLQR